MNNHQRAWIAAVVATVCTAGCYRARDSQSPSSHDAMQAADPLRVVRDKDASDRHLVGALSQVKGTEMAGPPEVWTTVINDPRFTDRHRARCFLRFFELYPFPGQHLSELSKIPGVSDWFEANAIADATSASRLPPEITRRSDGLVIVLNQPFLNASHSAVYVSFAGRTKIEDVDAVTHDKGTGREVILAAIGVSMGTLDDDTSIVGPGTAEHDRAGH